MHFCFAHLHIGTLHSKIPITDPGQIKGMKIRPANGTVAQFVSALGGTSVQTSAPEARDALEKGTADAITFPWKSILTFGIDKVARYHADMRLYQATFVWVINKKWYGSLSATQKTVIDDHCTNAWANRIGVDWGNDEDSWQGSALQGPTQDSVAFARTNWRHGRRRPSPSTVSGPPARTRPATTARPCSKSCGPS